LPVARLRAAPCGPRGNAGAASLASSDPFEVVARPERSPGVVPRTTLTKRPPGEDPSHPGSKTSSNQARLEPKYPFRAEAARYQRGSLTLSTGHGGCLGGWSAGRVQRPAAAIASSRWMKSRIATIVPSRISTT
jgi:hypothetical protein